MSRHEYFLTLPLAQDVTVAELGALRTAIDNLRTVFLAICPNTLLGGKETLTRNTYSFQETSFKSLIQLFILSSSIHATYVKPVDEMVRDDEALARERLGYARKCATLVRLTNQELELFPIVGGIHKPGVEHLCVTTGVCRASFTGVSAFLSMLLV